MRGKNDYPACWCRNCNEEPQRVEVSIIGNVCAECGHLVTYFPKTAGKLIAELQRELDYAKACCTALADEANREREMSRVHLDSNMVLVDKIYETREERDEALAHCTELAEDRDEWKDACLRARRERDDALALCTDLMDQRDRYKMVDKDLKARKFWEEHTTGDVSRLIRCGIVSRQTTLDELLEWLYAKD